jgi:hypothetical protein
MIIGTVIKQPREREDYDIDCRSAFNNDGNDFVVSASTIITPDDGQLAATPVVADGNTVKVWLQGGTVNAEYTVEVLVTTDAGRVKEDEILVKIVDFK